MRVVFLLEIIHLVSMTPTVFSRNSRWKVPVIALFLLLLVATVAAAMLWQMYRLHNRLIRREAAVSVLKNGREITSGLARQLVGKNGDAPFNNWPLFSQMVRALAAAEHQLQYVSVTRNDMNVFYEHTRALSDQTDQPQNQSIAPELVVPRGQRLRIGSNDVPVITFSLRFQDASGMDCLLEAGWRKQAVVVQEQVASRAILLLFRVTSITVLIAFGTSLLVVIWMVVREHRYERQRSAEEHLAYAGMLASGIVHDFRNPMSSLQLDAQMLRKETDKKNTCDMERVGKLSKRILQITGRMEKVFQEFLFISRPGTATREVTAVNRLLQECLSMLEPRMSAAKICVETDLSEEELMVSIYTESVRRALLNILINAEQHAGKNGRVFIRLQRDKRQAILSVANTGDRIAPSERKKVFELFYTTRPEGTGLGLFLARAAMQRNGGRLILDEEEGYATCLRIELPLAKDKG